METNIKDEKITSEMQFNKAIKEKPNAFVRVYMKGCGFCIQLEPEWEKLVNHIHNDSELKNNIKLLSIDSNNLDNINSLKEKVNGFPTLLFIKNGNVDRAEKYGETPDQHRTSDKMLEYIKEKRSMSGGRKTHRRIKNKKGRKSRKTNRKRTKSRAGRNKSRTRQKSKSRTRTRTRSKSRN